MQRHAETHKTNNKNNFLIFSTFSAKIFLRNKTKTEGEVHNGIIKRYTDRKKSVNRIRW